MINVRYKQAIIRMAVIASVLSLLLICGVPLIPVGFSQGIIPLGVFGIVFTVLGFYGTPLAWVAFSKLIAHKGVYSLIAEDGVYSITAISGTLGMTPKEARDSVTYLINKRYLSGFTFDGADTLTPVRPGRDNADDIDASYGKCPNCGATLIAEENKTHCPYCGSVFRNKHKW